MVIKPVLYNNSNPNTSTVLQIWRGPVLYNNNPNTFNTYISSRPGNQPSSAHIRATMFSPGKTPTEPRTSSSAHLRGYILARGETAINHASTQPHNVAASGLREPPKWETPYPTYMSSLFYCPYGLSFPAGAGILLLVGGSNPLSGL